MLSKAFELLQCYQSTDWNQEKRRLEQMKHRLNALEAEKKNLVHQSGKVWQVDKSEHERLASQVNKVSTEFTHLKDEVEKLDLLIKLNDLGYSNWLPKDVLKLRHPGTYLPTMLPFSLYKDTILFECVDRTDFISDPRLEPTIAGIMVGTFDYLYADVIKGLQEMMYPTPGWWKKQLYRFYEAVTVDSYDNINEMYEKVPRFGAVKKRKQTLSLTCNFPGTMTSVLRQRVRAAEDSGIFSYTVTRRPIKAPVYETFHHIFILCEVPRWQMNKTVVGDPQNMVAVGWLEKFPDRLWVIGRST